MKKEYLYKYLLFCVTCALGLASVIYYGEERAERRNSAPMLSYRSAVNTSVHTISFERNGFYINDTMYNAGGISWYSRVHDKNSTFTLNKIAPPLEKQLIAIL